MVSLFFSVFIVSHPHKHTYTYTYARTYTQKYNCRRLQTVGERRGKTSSIRSPASRIGREGFSARVFQNFIARPPIVRAANNGAPCNSGRISYPYVAHLYLQHPSYSKVHTLFRRAQVCAFQSARIARVLAGTLLVRRR